MSRERKLKKLGLPKTASPSQVFQALKGQLKSPEEQRELELLIKRAKKLEA